MKKSPTTIKNKLNYDKRHFWTMHRITSYLRSRLTEAVNLKSKYNVEVKYPKELWRLYYKELKEEKWYNKKVMGGPIPNLKKRGEFYKMLWYVDPAYWSDLINAVLGDKEIIKLIKTKMSKRIDTCRRLVEPLKIEYEEHWFPGSKMDTHLEAQNLHKVVTEKRHRDKFSPSYLDIRKAPNWNKIKWEMPDWDKKKLKRLKWLQYIKTSNKRWRKIMPDYAKTTYKLEDPNIDDMRYQKVTTWLLKHDWYEGKVNQFKHYTQKNINLIR